MRRVGDRLDAVLVGPAAPGAADHVDDDEGLAVVRMQPADADDVLPPSPAAGTMSGTICASAPEHGVEHAVAGQRARRDRRRRDRD